MGLSYEVGSLEEIDSALHNFYKQLDGTDKYVLDVEGVKPLDEFAKIQGALAKERNDHRSVKEKLSSFGELEPETVKQQLARIAELEELAKGSTIDDSKLEAMVAARLDAKLIPEKNAKEQALQKAAELEAMVSAYASREDARRMNEEFSAKIDAAKIDPRFKELVMYKAKEIFVKQEDGKYLTKDDYMPVEVWLSQQQAANPHWWGETQGGGSAGGKTGFKGENPFVTKDMDKIAAMTRDNPALAKKLAEAANSPYAKFL